MKQNTKYFLENRLARGIEAVCEIEPVTSYEYVLTVSETGTVEYEVTIERQRSENLSIYVPVFLLANNSPQWVATQILSACGWQKAEV